jgi:hypothetical protein
VLSRVKGDNERHGFIWNRQRHGSYANQGKLFAWLPSAALPDEVVAELLTTLNLRIERIVSTGQASPPDGWYDQEWDEWVILLRGGARLQFEGEPGGAVLGTRRLHSYRGSLPTLRPVD